MTRSGGTRAEVVASRTDVRRAIVTHDDWPGWTFAITINDDGLLVGFEMYGDGAAAGSSRLVNLRNACERPLIPPPDALTITARLLRQLPVRDLEATVRMCFRGHWGDIHLSRDLERRLREVRVEGPSQITKWNDHDLAQLAAEYVALLDGPGPANQLAARRFKNLKTVQNLLTRARTQGLLTAAPPGRKGGRLTDKAKELLDGQH